MSSLPSNPSESFKKRNPEFFGKITFKETPSGDIGVAVKVAEPDISVNESATLGKLNKTERRFYEYLKSGGPSYDYIGIQDLTFRLAWDTRYTPDFSTRFGPQVTLWEVKGFMRDDAAVKIKVAAAMWPIFRWIVVRWDNCKWQFEEVKR